MGYIKTEIKEGIKLHVINTNKFKTNFIVIFITCPLNRETVTLNSILPAVLRRGTSKLETMEKINTELENMYGASFDCGIEKKGDNHIIKFYIESINDKYLPENENILNKSIDIVLDIILNPLLEDGGFNKKYIEQEKETIRQLIESKIDSKKAYSLDRCIEEMFKSENYGLYKNGYSEDLENINFKNLYEYYLKMLSESKIDIFVSGEVDEKYIIENISKKINLEKRNPIVLIDNNISTISKVNEIEEKMDVNQGNLVMGLRVENIDEKDMFATSIYNTILGLGGNSKLFQNVREKASLAYTANSTYLKQKNVIFIRCGIETDNYQKTLDIIKVQLDDLKKGNFTEKDIENAKILIENSIISLADEQPEQITYYIGQELLGTNLSEDEYIENIKGVTKEEIVRVANGINIDTIYFLTTNNMEVKGE